MSTIEMIHIGKDALERLVEYCRARGLQRFTLVADRNTYAALGERVQATLTADGAEVHPVVLEGAEIIADAHYLTQVLLHAPVEERTYLAVGSGTLTDITRFVSHRTRTAFISLPSAPSVDGFTSIGAPLVIGGVKLTYNCQAPRALFADLDTLMAAPQRLVAAGYADLLGKITSLADWAIGHLVWDEPYDETIAGRTRKAVDACVERADAIGAQSEEGVRLLMDGLIESGLCMLDFGSSRPASGAEHHASHYWEMTLLREGRPAILHGAKVGYATTLIAQKYARVRQMSRQELMDRLEQASTPDREAEMDHIRQGYGPLADDVIREQAPFLNLSAEGYDALKLRIAARWDAIQQVVQSVPPPEVVIDLLKRGGAVTDAQTLGLSEDEVAGGLAYGHYLRNRFTVVKLSRVLGLE